MVRFYRKNYNKILTEVAKILALLSSSKIDKNEFLTGEGILPSGQSSMKITYSPLGKEFEKQIKTTEDEGIK